MRVRSTMATTAAGAVLSAGILAGCGGEGAQDPGSTGGEQSRSEQESGNENSRQSDDPTGSTDSADGDGPAESDGPADGSATATTPDSLTFTGTTISGAEFDGSALAGGPVVLWFWAPWCSTCASQSGTVADLEEQHGDEVSFVGVSSLGERSAMREFVRTTDVGGFPQLADENGEVWQHFGITAQSTFVVLDADGSEVRSGHVGLETLSDDVERLAGNA